MMINQPYGIRCHTGGPARPALSYKITVDKWRLGYTVREGLWLAESLAVGGRKAREFRRDRACERSNQGRRGDHSIVAQSAMHRGLDAAPGRAELVESELALEVVAGLAGPYDVVSAGPSPTDRELMLSLPRPPDRAAVPAPLARCWLVDVEREALGRSRGQATSRGVTLLGSRP
jgi:hypothetical protein